jgi:hypothetical protein
MARAALICSFPAGDVALPIRDSAYDRHRAKESSK